MNLQINCNSCGSNLVTFGNGLVSVPLLKALISQAPALWDLGHHAAPGSLDSGNEIEQHSEAHRSDSCRTAAHPCAALTWCNLFYCIQLEELERDYYYDDGWPSSLSC